MITLGIETSCDETACAIVRGKTRVLSNIVYSSLKEHSPYGGVVPEIASRAQLETILPCLEASLKRSRVSLKAIDLIAVTKGPGLMGSLLVGSSAAKALSLVLKKPLIGVDHVIAHAWAAFLSEKNLRFPFLALVISGGHTLLLRLDGPSRIQVLGRTLDDAAGEAFDKVAKILGLGYPGGPAIDRLSRGQNKKTHFTRPYLSHDSLDFSFSGIKTAVFYHVEGLRKKKNLTAAAKREICAGFQEAVCEVLVEKSLRAAQSQKLSTLVVGGGVSANSRLRTLFRKAAAKKDRVIFPRASFCQDNAAMIAGLGAALYREGRQDTLDLSSYSTFRF